jgi:glyoxylase-like metal-dependent hydrolase (beta-lactamase superfamily II)
MPKPTTQHIRSLRYYNCGHCINRLGFAYQGYPLTKQVFPAGVFLIEHEKGYILFDTGYSPTIYKTGFKGWLYRSFNPTHVREDQSIEYQLQQDGISTNDVSHVIISHLHPDHIGGLKSFSNSTVIISKDAVEGLKKPTVTDLIFESLLPDIFDTQTVILEQMGLQTCSVKSFTGYDLFGDQSIVIGHLKGHARGHIGAMVAGNILLAGDACWRTDLLDVSHKMRQSVKLLHHNHAHFLDTVGFLQTLQKEGVKLCFSHDTYQIKDVLNEQ